MLLTLAMKITLKQVVMQIDEDLWRDFRILAAKQRLGATQMLRLMVSQALTDYADGGAICFDGKHIKPPGKAGSRILEPGTQWTCEGGRWAIAPDSE